VNRAPRVAAWTSRRASPRIAAHRRAANLALELADSLRVRFSTLFEKDLTFLRQFAQRRSGLTAIGG